ncbi:hypothetical protein V2J09_015177 [Rumex salicifolius]
MSISSSFRALAFKFPHQIVTFTPNFPLRKTLISSPNFPSSFPFFKSISFERVSNTKTSYPPQSLPSASSSSPLQSVEELPPKLREIIQLFQGVQQPKAKYEQLLFYGHNLSPLDERYKTRENKVEGCVSQVWVRAYLDPDKNVWFEADSDSVLTKGLAALLVQGLSGRPVPEIIRVTPDFITLLGLQQSLTPSRNNGFLNMLKLMQKKALFLAVEDQRREEQGYSVSESKIETEVHPIDDEIESPSSSLSPDSNSASENDNDGVVLGGRADRIKQRLEKELNPIELVVDDVSYQHAGHAGNRTGEDGTHINLKIVSKEFEGKTVVKRHRMIYALLQDELESGLHALKIKEEPPLMV